MWRQRAQFMLLLMDVSSMVKLAREGVGKKCELCGSEAHLVSTPIYTLTHLASLYRQQRDMSPLWNMPLWKHFYKTFTPTCTVCDKCSQEYYALNQNIPVDEQRFKRLQAPAPTPHTVAMGSDLPLSSIDPAAAHVLRIWLAWTKDLVNDEKPCDFLPKYGFEGRTAAEIRRAQAEADREEESFPSSSEDEEETRKEQEQAEKEERLAQFEVEIVQQDAELPLPPRLPWSSQAILGNWLQRARQNLEAPQLNDWERPLQPPPDPYLPPPPDF
jgi:hypothetical protein